MPSPSKNYCYNTGSYKREYDYTDSTSISKYNPNATLASAISQNDSYLLLFLLGLDDSNDINHIRLSDKKMLLLQKVDVNGETVIFLAVRTNNLKALQLLLLCGADVVHRNKMDETAIEIAYQMKAWPYFLLLIKAHSLFPSQFDPNLIPDEEYKLLSLLERKCKISELIADGKIKEVGLLIEEEYIKPSFKNIYNQSAVSIAFAEQKYEIFVLLKSRGFKELWHEKPINTDELSYLEKSLIKNIMASYMKS